MEITRHGAEMHVVRPDRVMRTSVIVPFTNYSPQHDVQAVAAAFTTGGPLATTLSGLGQLNFFQRIALRIKARMAAKRAQQFMMAGLMGSPGPAPVVASQVAPQMQAQMFMLQHLMQHDNPGHIRQAVGDAAYALQMRRPFTYYRAG